MRLAKIVQVKDGELQIPEAFARPMGLYEGSKLYVSKVKGHPQHQILTTIPRECWKRILRVTVLLEHRAGALDVIARALSDLGASILVMEGFGREPDEEGWWSGVVELPLEVDGDAMQALDGMRTDIIEKLHCIYSTPSKEGGFPFPKRLRAENQGATVEKFDHGLRTLTGEHVVLVENMRLTELEGRVYKSKVIAYDPATNSVDVGKDFTTEGKTVWGLLMCNTEERFVRFVEIRSPVEIELEVVVKSDDPLRVGVGLLPKLTEILRTRQTGELHPGINIVYLFNYITERRLEHASGLTWAGRQKAAGVVEKSVIQFFLETPPGWAAGSKEDEHVIENEWFGVFQDLARAEVSGKKVVNWERATMRLWHGREATYVLDKVGEVNVLGVGKRILRRIKMAGFNTFSSLGVLVLAISVGLGFWWPEWASIVTGIGGVLVTIGLFIQGRRQG